MGGATRFTDGGNINHPNALATPARNRAIAAAYAQGVSITALGRQYGISRQRVMQICEVAIAAGQIERRKRLSHGSPPRLAERNARIVELWELGAPVRVIAAIVGVTIWACYRALARARAAAVGAPVQPGTASALLDPPPGT